MVKLLSSDMTMQSGAGAIFDQIHPAPGILKNERATKFFYNADSGNQFKP